MHSLIPTGFEPLVEPMIAGHHQLLHTLTSTGLHPQPYPTALPPGNPAGVAAARAFPMQGILKYHGLSDWNQRIAFLPSVSVCNDAGYTLTYVAFEPTLAHDHVIIGGQIAQGREHQRVVQSLDAVRQLAHITSRARVISHNRVRSSKVGKGLGTSASASAALALAAIQAAFGPELAQNTRFVTTFARLLAGSGCRSASGGVSLWLSYPGAPHEESFAIRLDDQGQLDDLRLITIPLDSRIGLKTEQAHEDAPRSSFFTSWMLSRPSEAATCIQAARQGDWRTLGQWAELDSIRLHGVTMSGSMEQKLFAWEPENIPIFRMCNQLRAAGHPVYASTDTGPTVVLLTHKDHEDAVVEAMLSLELGLEVVRGRIGGPAHTVPVAAALAELQP